MGKSISVDASGEPGVPGRPLRTGRATPVAPLAKATGHYSRSVVMLGRAFVLLEGIAAVNDQQLSGDVGGRFGGKKHDGSGDFVGAAGTTYGSIFTGDKFRSGRGCGFDPAGIYGVHRHYLTCNLQRKSAYKPVQCLLGGAVVVFRLTI